MRAVLKMAAGIVLGATSPIATAQPAATEVSIFAAGSPRSALSEVGRSFEAAHPGTRLRYVFGVSGLLEDRPPAGEPADVFASPP